MNDEGGRDIDDRDINGSIHGSITGNRIRTRSNFSILLKNDGITSGGEDLLSNLNFDEGSAFGF